MLKLDMPIIEVIEEYPIINDFSLKNKIDCITCSIGTCLMKDVLNIHNFSKENQQKMLEHMEKLVNKETVELLEFESEISKKNYSKIIEMLIEEHKLVIELIYITEYLISLPNFLNIYIKDVDKILYYLKYYADDYHHGKEEDVLFNLFEENDILKIMNEEHDIGRELRMKIVNSNDEQEIKGYLKEYIKMLKEHIHKEDNILFPYLDRNLDEEKLKVIDESLKEFDLSMNNQLSEFLSDFNRRMFSM